jgi:hypothetical protein
VEVKGERDFDRLVLAETRGAAAYSRLLDLRECWPSVSFLHLRVTAASPRENPILAKHYFAPGKKRLSDETVSQIRAFLATAPGVTRAQWEHSYPAWARGGDAWRIACLGGTEIMRALAWYHSTHPQGANEDRPPIILRAILTAVESALPPSPPPAVSPSPNQPHA